MDRIGDPQPIFTATTTNSRGRREIRWWGVALSEDGKTLFAAYYSEPPISETETGDTMFATFSLPQG